MFGKILFTISIFKIIDCFYLEAESNYLKPKLERNNIVNKGIWVRKKLQDLSSEKNNLGNFIFRANSIDVDNGMQNNDVFEDTPFVTKYFHRRRRSPEHIRKRRPRKSMKMGKVAKTSIEDSVMIKSKIVSDLKPISVFNEYPYEVAILLNSDQEKVKNSTLRKEGNEKETNVSKPEVIFTNNTDAIEEEFEVVPLNTSTTVSTDVPKRSKKYDVKYDQEVNSYNLVEEYNNTEMVTKSSKLDRDVFQKVDNIEWKLNTRIPDNNVYNVVPIEPKKSKSVTERGLIKIISMLTKTFKKIMKKHTEIKNIHDKLINVNQNFDRKVTELTTKFEDFDSKYSDMIEFNNKIKSFESELSSQKQYFDTKQRDIQSTLTEFQDQQKKFLAQQRQFYAIQKLMLAQNEKINAKQNLIAKTQSQISHRQNNFARILKKAKQIINDNKTKIIHAHGPFKQQDKSSKFDIPITSTTTTTTTVPPITDAMKINLFSIPTKSKLENQDALIIKEKDEKQIDDLVYKYYFNNTFIDSLMKSKILNNYASALNNVEIVSRSKQSKKKRDELETTVMLPIKNSLSDIPAKRERRWINHFSKNKYKRLNRHRKKTTALPVFTETNKQNDTKLSDNKIDPALNEVKLDGKGKSDPFMAMAYKFCNEIGQNANEQVLKWCAEKAMRKLKFMEINAFTPPQMIAQETKKPLVEDVANTKEKLIDKRYDLSTQSAVSAVPPLPTVPLIENQANTFEPFDKKTSLYAVTSVTNQEIFFPDNDALESNLKQYELTPDTEGNVYYDGSLHISDYGPNIADSGATSDIMPGLMDSNSKVDIDPMTFDIQAKRRAYVRRINENIIRQMRG